MSWVEVVVGDLSKQPDQQLRRDWPSSIHSYPSTQFSLLTFLMTWSTAGGIFQSIVSPEKFVNKKEDNRSHDFADSTQKSLISLSFLETEWDSKGGNWVSNVSLEGWRVGGRCGGSRRRGGGLERGVPAWSDARRKTGWVWWWPSLSQLRQLHLPTLLCL